MKISRFDQEIFLEEIFDNILNRTSTPNHKHFEKEVAKYNETIAEVAEWLEVLDDEEYRQSFIKNITEKECRGKAMIASQGANWLEKLKAKREQALQLKREELHALEEPLEPVEDDTLINASDEE